MLLDGGGRRREGTGRVWRVHGGVGGGALRPARAGTGAGRLQGCGLLLTEVRCPRRREISILKVGRITFVVTFLNWDGLVAGLAGSD